MHRCGVEIGGVAVDSATGGVLHDAWGRDLEQECMHSAEIWHGLIINLGTE